MAFFSKSKKENSVSNISTIPTASKAGSANITGCMEISGSVKGCGTLHIDGKIDGDLTVDENAVIGKDGVVKGDVSAKNVIVSGKVHGCIKCETLEVTQTGEVLNTIHASKVVTDGKIEAGMEECDLIHITQNGVVKTKKMTGKQIIVNGNIEGNVVATELLEISKDGCVKGEMMVKKIKVLEGGLMLGTMMTYEPTNPVRKVSKKDEGESVVKNEQAASLKEVVNTKDKE